MQKTVVSIILLLIIVVLNIYCTKKIPEIWDVYVINLDKDKDRWKNTKNQMSNIQRWPATNGSECTAVDYQEAGFFSGEPLPFKSGVVGCWLSHKRLLQHIKRENYPANAGHLILEDDVVIPMSFWYEWKQIAWQIPSTWDMIFLGNGTPLGKSVGTRLLKGHPGEANTNTGTFAYIVRHGSIEKIESYLAKMTAPIDNQYCSLFDKLDVYIVSPYLIGINMKVPSTINP